MFEFLKKAQFKIVAVLAGVLLVVLSFFQIEDIKAFHIVPLPSPLYPLFILGVAIVIFSLIADQIPSLLGRNAFTSAPGAQIRSISDGLVATVARSRVSIRWGHLETLVEEPQSSLVVLPANEYFNDECISDSRSALGAFLQAKFSGRTENFRQLIAQKLAGLGHETVVVDGETRESFGLGAAVYLDRPFAESYRILVAAATTQRTGEGLKCDTATILKIVRAAITTANDHRLNHIFVPLLGAGHGSIRPELALITQLLGWCESFYANPGRGLEVSIVIFQRAGGRAPDVGRECARKLLSVATYVCSPTTTE